MGKKERFIELVLLSLPLIAALAIVFFVDSSDPDALWGEHIASKIVLAYLIVAIPGAIFRLKGVQLTKAQLTGRNGVIIWCTILFSAALVVAFA